MLNIVSYNCMPKMRIHDIKCFQLRCKNLNVFVHTQKRIKTYTVHFNLWHITFSVCVFVLVNVTVRILCISIFVDALITGCNLSPDVGVISRSTDYLTF